MKKFLAVTVIAAVFTTVMMIDTMNHDIMANDTRPDLPKATVQKTVDPKVKIDVKDEGKKDSEKSSKVNDEKKDSKPASESISEEPKNAKSTQDDISAKSKETIIARVDTTADRKPAGKKSVKISVNCKDKTYALNESICFNVTIHNTGIDTSVVVSDRSGSRKIELKSDDTYSYTTEWIVSEDDILKGSVEYNVSAILGKRTETASAVARTEKVRKDLVIISDEASAPENGVEYVQNETVFVKTTVLNNGNVTMKSVRVVSEHGYEWVIRSIAPGETIVLEGSYKILNGPRDGDAEDDIEVEEEHEE